MGTKKAKSMLVPRKHSSTSSLKQRLSRKVHRAAVAAYTVMEVMIALGVLSIGATGVVALQKATIVGNVRARDLATANVVASSWLERLNADGLRWQQLNNGTSTINNTLWLQAVGNDFPTVGGTEGVWLKPTQTAIVSGEADVRGKDVITATPTSQTAFCTNIRVTQLTRTLIRAEVRVFWLRRKGGGVVGGGTDLCSGDPAYLLAIEPARDRYHFVYATTGIIRAPSSD